MRQYCCLLLLCLLCSACASQAPLGKPVTEPSSKPLTEPPPLLQGVAAQGGASAAGAGRAGAVAIELLAGSCTACHGPKGHSQAPSIPSIAGLPQTYLINALEAFQYGGRYNTVMGRIALGYDAAEIRQLADYFSQQSFVPVQQRVNWQQVNLGRQLHRLYCRECHGDLEAIGQEDAARLNGQWMDYLRWTLQDYLVGINQGDMEMSRQLTRMLRRHGRNGLEALVHYYGSGRP